MDEGWRRYAYSPVGVIIIFVLTIVLANSVIGIYGKLSRSRALSAGSNQQLEELLSQKEALEAEIERLETAHGIEAELRNDFQIARPGEETVVFIDDREETESPEQE